MQIAFKCGFCENPLVADVSLQGQKTICPVCGKHVIIPSANKAPESKKTVVRLPRETPKEAPPPEEKAIPEPQEEEVPPPDKSPHNLEIVVGWICVIVGTILALLLPNAKLVYLTFFMGAFLMSCVLFVRRKILHWIVLLLCTCIPPPLLMRQNIWRNVAPPPSAPVQVVQAVQEPKTSATKKQKVVIDKDGEIKVVPVTEPPVSQSARSAGSGRASAGQSAPADPFAETVEMAQKSNRSHEPTAQSAEDQYEALLKSQDDVPPLIPEDVLASTPMGHDPDFVWQKATAAETLLPGDPAPVVDIPFVVYSEEGNKETYSATGRMGNKGDLQFDQGWDIDPHTGSTCIYVRYASSEDWVTVAWQHPGHNWGEVVGGFDLTKARKLTFWAKGETGRETVEFMVGMEQAQSAVSRDSLRTTTGPIRLKKEWKKYTIPIEEMDRSRLITGFLFRIEGQGKPVVFFLDDIQFE